MGSEVLDKAVGGMYTESKLVYFRLNGFSELDSDSYTYEKADARIAEFVKDGWTPTSISTLGSTLAVLFCR